MNRYAIIYNICEIKRTNLDWYIKCLDNLLKTDYDFFDIIVSGCKVSQPTKDALLERYGDRIMFNFIDIRLTVNVTFNFTVLKVRELKGEYDGYVYIDSGVDIDQNYHFLKELDVRYQTGNYEMVMCQTDTDTGYHHFGLHGYFYDHDFVVPVGKACNSHVILYGKKLLDTYGKLIPDIFLAYCTESVFSFLVAAISSRWLIVKDMILTHERSLDGASSGYDHTGERKAPWNNLYGGMDMLSIINDPKAREVGLGYEECGNIMMHDGNLFTPKGFAKNPELKTYIKNKLFLQEDQLNYSHIPFEFYYEDQLVNTHS